jgi:AcrR family transcriptional regulator
MAEARSTYHHGDLRAALVRAALDMARDHGSEAVVLREATRRTGVTPRAAYRHFADREALLYAAAQAALGEMARAIEAQQAADTALGATAADRASPEAAGHASSEAAGHPSADHAAQARPDGLRLLNAVGLGYIRFALAEPGWFDVAFFAMGDLLSAASPEARGSSGRSPYEHLQDALAVLVAEGRLAPERVDAAAVLCWSGVHGFAALTALGPLRELSPEAKDAQAQQVVADLVSAVTMRADGP